MISWPSPFIPAVPGTGLPLQVFDTAAGRLRPLAPGPVAEIYVCGITPYDATHIGHAATYVTFDLVGRVLRDAGHDVIYVQNVTDVDEPLFERAEREGIDWSHLARAHFVARRYAEAVDCLRHMTRLSDLQHAFLAACLARGGDVEAAAAHVGEALKLRPGLRVDADCVPMLHYRRADDLAHHRDSLLAAGLPA